MPGDNLMIKLNDIGLFGKLPAHGDFIHRDLPIYFINRWDEWLQGFIANSQKELGEEWLDIYLTSPIWRFVFTDGICDQCHWAGILLPSVDRVGRYFPFTIVTRIPSPTNAFMLIQQADWFAHIENLALSALEGQLRIEDLVIEINKKKMPLINISHQKKHNENSSGIIFQFNDDVSPINHSLPYLLDNTIRQRSPSYSIWCTANGSERVSPLIATTTGLPNIRNTTALLDGNWASSDWSLISEISNINHSSFTSALSE